MLRAMRDQEEQIWNIVKVGAICGDNPGGDGLSGARKRIGSPQQGAEERGQRARPFKSVAFGVESGDGGKRQQGHSGWKSRQGS